MPPAPPPESQSSEGAPDLSVIDRSPLTPGSHDFNSEESDFYLGFAGQLAAENQELAAEIERLKGKKTYDDVRAGMMEPYANKVFRFLVGYCLFVGALVLLSGFRLGGFQISDVVLGIIAGSTAVSAIGLVGFVVSGLFGVKRADP